MKKPTVPEWTRHAGKTVVVPVELSPAAHAILSGFALHLGHGSVGEYLLALAKADVAALGAALDSDQERLDALFTGDGKEAA